MESKDFSASFGNNTWKIKYPPLNIMVVGSVKSGKSSTINAFLGRKVAPEGYSFAPTTDNIYCHSLLDVNGHEVIKFWDTQGIGVSPEKDNFTLQQIETWLKPNYIATTGMFYPSQIDIVLVVLDCKTLLRSEITALKELLDMVFRNVDNSRVFFALNKADLAMKGQSEHWDYEQGMPDKIMDDKLNQISAQAVQRIADATGKSIRTFWQYSANYSKNPTEEIKSSEAKSLLCYILEVMPPQQERMVQMPSLPQ